MFMCVTRGWLTDIVGQEEISPPPATPRCCPVGSELYLSCFYFLPNWKRIHMF